MNRKLTWMEAFAASQVAAWSAVGCLSSAFRMEVTALWEIGGIFAAVSLACILILSLRRGGWFLLAADGLAFWLLWRWELVQEPFLSMLGTIARVYDSGYSWGIPDILKNKSCPPDMAFLLLGIGVIECVCLAVCRRKGTSLAVASLVIPLAACLVVTDTVPDARWLYVLLLCLALLLITGSVRAESGGQGTKLALTALIPTALALGLLFYLVPRDTYENRTEPLRTKLIACLEEMPEQLQSGRLTMPSFTRQRDQVDLASLAAQPQLGLPVAEVAAENGATVYLRVKDYDIYTGTSWLSTADRQETLVGTGTSRGSVVVRQLSAQSSMLLPAYPEGEILLEGGAVSGAGKDTVYRVDSLSSAMGARPGAEWLALPENTREGAEAILQSISAASDDTEAVAQAIADYVRGSAVYDRRPSSMDAGQEDFALWFLTEAERGYCVHFATSAAVLLRSAGIPARYVTGYKVDTTPGVTSRVTSNDAHAWVEYYNYATWSWSILESTPGTAQMLPAEQGQEETQTVQQEIQADTHVEAALPIRATEPEKAQPEPEKRQLPMGLFLGIAIAALLAAAVELQRALRLSLRAKRQSRGDANHRAMEKWKELTVLTRLVGRKMPEELTALVEKAMFSQHILEKEELNRFTGYAAQCRRKLRGEKLWKRLKYRYWDAVI